MVEPKKTVKLEAYALAYCRISSRLQAMANRGYTPLIAVQMALAGELGTIRGESLQFNIAINITQYIIRQVRRGGWAAESGGLENRWGLIPSQGSNPCFSANKSTTYVTLNRSQSRFFIAQFPQPPAFIWSVLPLNPPVCKLLRWSLGQYVRAIYWRVQVIFQRPL